ncbi:hypothetical protein AK812_SmicGene13632 [Symbiodinium microadriaticum]|uniref:Uncharacterized protein n=1 Tax=Symbiodinium microadriaticum TaxID=2951 RepID=A0A1Q9E7Q8_SYMMI|nr:hypothetical protein AK812_SmicGene13632 [Symbiodinium microadriaticum]
MVQMDDHGHGPTVIGAAVDDDLVDVDLNSLDDETQRFVLETHLENIGFIDFMGFELASLSSQHSSYNNLPNVSGGRGAGGGMGNASAFAGSPSLGAKGELCFGIIEFHTIFRRYLFY